MACRLDLKGKSFRTDDECGMINFADVMNAAGQAKGPRTMYKHWLVQNDFYPVYYWGERCHIDGQGIWITFPQAQILFKKYPNLRRWLYPFTLDERAKGNAKTWARKWIPVVNLIS